MTAPSWGLIPPRTRGPTPRRPPPSTPVDCPGDAYERARLAGQANEERLETTESPCGPSSETLVLVRNLAFIENRWRNNFSNKYFRGSNPCAPSANPTEVGEYMNGKGWFRKKTRAMAGAGFRGLKGGAIGGCLRGQSGLGFVPGTSAVPSAAAPKPPLPDPPKHPLVGWRRLIEARPSSLNQGGHAARRRGNSLGRRSTAAAGPRPRRYPPPGVTAAPPRTPRGNRSPAGAPRSVGDDGVCGSMAPANASSETPGGTPRR